MRAVYDGGVRLLCPHILGCNREGGVRILCLQIGGDSASGLRHKDGPGDGRCLALEKFSSAERFEAGWPTAVLSSRRPKCLDRIELEVADQPPREPQQGH